MLCLQKYVLSLMVLHILGLAIVHGHVGEKCPFVILFRMCMASNAYCDKNNICQCKPDYPIKVDTHTCKKPRRYGERCSVTAECSYLDSNSYCTQLSYHSVCECHEGFRYDSVNDNCAKVEKARSSSPNLLLPIAVGLSLAFACLICCCLVSVHICRARRRQRNHRTGSLRAMNTAGHRRNSSEGVRLDSRSQRLPSTPSAPEDIGILPPYDVAVTLQPIKEPDMVDELPPSYDEVMKDS